MTSVSIAREYKLDSRGSIPGEAYINTGGGVTELPIQWVPGALSHGVKGQGREADHSPPSNADVKSGAIPLFPTRLHVIMFNQLMRGTILLYLTGIQHSLQCNRTDHCLNHHLVHAFMLTHDMVRTHTAIIKHIR
jgi:hypothetical protein